MQKRTQQVHKNALGAHKHDTQTVRETHAQNIHKKCRNTHNRFTKKVMKTPLKIRKHTASSKNIENVQKLIRKAYTHHTHNTHTKQM